MKMRKELIILILVIAALSLYIFLQKRGKTHYALPVLKNIAEKDISKITIEKEGPDISLQRDGERWIILPQKYPADGTQVKEMVDAIGSPALTALASESKSYSIYELDEGRKIAVTIYKGGDALRKVDIGKAASSFSHTFVKIDDDHRVYHARGNLKNTFDKDVPALRDKKVMKIDEEVIEISLKEGKKEINIVRRAAPAPDVATPDRDEKKEEQGEVTNKRESKWITADGNPVVDEKADEIVETLKELRCDGFVEDKTKVDLKNPIFTVTLTGTASHTLSLLDKKSTQYVATSSGSDYPFLLSEWKAEKIKKDLNSLIVKEKISTE
jgi:hypothetical protein